MAMELHQHDPLRSRGVRIKLRFEDPTILCPQQLDDGLSTCWFVVRSQLRFIGDLASDIASCFQLYKTCPHGISLRMDSFTLPPSQPAWLLKDEDIVSVNKKKDQCKSAHSDLKLTNSLGLDDSDTVDGNRPSGFRGIKLRAIDEFERETGGYQSEQEEDGWESLNEEKNVMDVLVRTTTTGKGSLKKKRKRTENDVCKGEREQGYDLQMIPYNVEGKGTKHQKPKKKSTIVQEKIQEADKVQKPKKSKKQRDVINSNLAEDEAGEKKRSSKKESRKNKAGDRGKQNVVDDGDLEDSQKLCSPKSPQYQNVEAKEKQGIEVEPESTSKPSRSARRKKAKRRWKREHTEALATAKNENSGRVLVIPNHKEDNNTLPVSQNSCGISGKNEDDVEAEEERLPLVVRPGHIRFEPLDEEEGSHPVQHSVPLLCWNHGISKRQGQSWGQERGVGKRGGKKSRETASESIELGKITLELLPSSITFESLPSLKILPQEGDILAYRVVELTSSMCPELCEYRVGHVTEFDGGSGKIKLAALPNYPIKKNIADTEQKMSCDEAFCSPYNEDGSLETEFTSLVDVRVVRSLNEVHGILDSHAQDKSNVPSRIDNPPSFSMEAATPLSNSTAEAGQIDKRPSNNCFNTSLKDAINCTPGVEGIASTCHPEILGQGVVTNFASAWQELSEVLDKKKEELSKLEGVIENNGYTGLDEEKNRSGNIVSVVNGREKVEKRNGAQRKSWSFRSKRAAALGPTMALLRAQNVL